MDAGTYEQDEVTGIRNIQVGVNETGYIPSYVVSSYGTHFLLCQPLRGIGTHATSLQIAVCVLPERTIAGTYKYDIALLYRTSLLLHSCGKVGLRDRRIGSYAINTAIACDIEQHSSRVMGAIVSTPSSLKPVEVCSWEVISRPPYKYICSA